MTFKNRAFLAVGILMLFSIGFSGCATTSGVFSEDVLGKEWILSEFRNGGKTIRINGAYDIGLGEIYTITFEEGRVTGIGAPNRYFGPYTIGSENTLKMGPLASTLMASFRELDELREHEYFSYLNSVNRWKIQDHRLELYSLNDDGSDTILIFSPK